MATDTSRNCPNHIMIGLGGTGGKVIKAIKKRWYREFPSEEERRSHLPYLGFIYVDSTEEMMNKDRTDPSWRVLGQDATFTGKEFVQIRPSGGINEIIDHIESYPQLRHIVKSAESMKNSLGHIAAAAGQKRRAGRIMFASNCDTFIAKLKGKKQEMSSKEFTGKDPVHFHIFTGLAGGTGSGSIIDVVAQTRKEYPESTIDVYAMVPEKEVPEGFDAGQYQQNGYAALRELNALNVKRFFPCDISNGDEEIQFPPKALEGKNLFNLMLYSNVNSNGIVADSITELPELLADAVFYRLFLPDNENTTKFFRAWSCENFNNFETEKDTRPNHAEEDARTKRTTTFGIKRIVYPEARILEHISYTLNNSVIRQMRYNNFNEEDFGYVDEAPKRDYSEMFNKGGYEKTWKLDEEHLLLQERIVESDEAFENFENFWNEKVTFYNHDDAQRFSPQPLEYVDNFCLEIFKQDFRLGKGVADYYKDKSSGEPLKIQADTIIDAIEQDLYSGWADGTYSMHDLEEICKEILRRVDDKLKGIDGDVTKCQENINTIIKTRDTLKEEYNKAGLITKFVGLLGGRSKPEIFSDYQAETQDLYIEMTRKEAKAFEKKLLKKLQEAFDAFVKDITEFLSKLHTAQERLDAEILARNGNDQNIYSRDLVVEIRENDKIANFERKILIDQAKMRKLSAEVRKTLTGGRKYMHFNEMSEKITENRLLEIADEQLSPIITDWHNSDPSFVNDKVVGMNVIEQLYKLIGDNDTVMTRFANGIMDESGVFLQIDDGECRKKTTNTIPEKPEVGTHIHHRFMMISMPTCEKTEALKKFGKVLESKLTDSASSGKSHITPVVDHEGAKSNEITIICIDSLFPIRSLEWLPSFKRKYDDMINNSNEMIRQNNRIMLHSQGDGQDLPSLEQEGEGKISSKQLTAYLLIAAALGKGIKWGTTKNEEEGWCSITTNVIGDEKLEVISSKFTELTQSVKFTTDVKSKIIKDVEEFLNDKDLTTSQRKAVADKIIELIREKIIKETSQGSTKYEEYVAATEEAVKLVTNKK